MSGTREWSVDGSCARRLVTAALCVLLAGGCSLRRFAVNRIGDALSSGASTFEAEEDIDLVVDALPFGLILLDSLVQESPRHAGLRLAACRGFVLYAFAHVDFEAERAYEEDIERYRQLRERSRRLYARAHAHCLAALERDLPGFAAQVSTDPVAAAARIDPRHPERDLPRLYWTAASLGLSISSGRDRAALLARLPEAEALVMRGLELGESWNRGAFHALQLQLLAASVTGADRDDLELHYRRALELAGGRDPGLFVTWAEAVAVPDQDGALFRRLLNDALAFDLDSDPENRLVNGLAQRRARWLLDRAPDLILELEEEGR